MVERLGETRKGRRERIEKASRERIEKERKERKEKKQKGLRRQLEEEEEEHHHLLCLLFSFLKALQYALVYCKGFIPIKLIS